MIKTMQFPRNPLQFLRFLINVHKHGPKYDPTISCYSISIDTFDMFTNELAQRHRTRLPNNNPICGGNFMIRNFMGAKNKPFNVTDMSKEELHKLLLHLLLKNQDNEVIELLSEMSKIRKFLSEPVLKKLLKDYSYNGKPEMVVAIQKYCAKVDPYMYKRNCEYQHYLAKAQCLKGNSEKGLNILKELYKKHENFRSLYRIILRELIQDTVMNRSEASMVIFRKFVLEFSEEWSDHYPLVCLWHMCWSSSWFSDQVLSNELLDTSEHLLEIVRDKATAFSINILRLEYNEDAVVRLLQALLKYKMMVEYVKVLQVLFAYKLKNKDVRGCSEIMRNCEVLGVTLPPNQQGRYIQMLINGDSTTKSHTDFKLKF